MSVLDFIKSYTTQDFIKTFANELFLIGNLSILTTNNYDETKSYNQNDKVLFSSEKTNYLTKRFISLEDDNTTSPDDETKWEVDNTFQPQNYITKEQIQNTLLVIQKSNIIDRCFIDKTFQGQQAMEVFMTNIINLYIAKDLYDTYRGSNITKGITTSESVDGMSVGRQINPQLLDMKYLTLTKNQFGLKLLDLLLQHKHPGLCKADNTQEDFEDGDI